MNKKKLLIPLFLLSAMLFVGIGIYMAGKKHVVKVEENFVLNKENFSVKNENYSLKVENSKLKNEVKSLKNEIQLRDSIEQAPKVQQAPKVHVPSNVPSYTPYRIFTNQLPDTNN